MQFSAPRRIAKINVASIYSNHFICSMAVLSVLFLNNVWYQKISIHSPPWRVMEILRGAGIWKRYISEGERCTERVFYPLSIRWYIVTGLLIFRAVAELRISSKSAKSREIHLKTCKMSKVLARSHEITNKPLRVRTTKTLWLPTWKTNKCASDVKKMKNRRKQNFEGEANNMQLDKEDTRLSK